MESNELFTKEFFPFYYLKFTGSTSKWTSEIVGAYLLLLIDQWANGFIPDNIKEQLTVAKCDKKTLAKVLTKFKLNDDGKLRNERLEIIRAEQYAKYLGTVKKTEAANEAKRLKKLSFIVTPSERPANAQDNANVTQLEKEKDISKDIGKGVNTPPSTPPSEKPKVVKKLFVKPENWNEVANYMRDYLKEKGITWARELIQQESEKFMNHYTGNGWMVGKNPMKDWKATVRNWVTNVGQYGKAESKLVTNQPFSRAAAADQRNGGA